MVRIDRDNEGSIEIEDLHLFFGDEITVLLTIEFDFRLMRSSPVLFRHLAN